jgi:hypothetical protein
MKIYREVAGIYRLLAILAVCFIFAGAGLAFAADEKTPNDLNLELKEMPVLTGEEWQTFRPETKIAFIWGIGHVVTIEEHVIKRHPELSRQGFTAKLAEGLRGIPMNNIIQVIDSYYQNNPDDLDLPVMRVIWSQIVKPKLKTGVADQPLHQNGP